LQEKLVGIIFLGDKKSGDVFSVEDLRMLEIISKQSAVAIQNSQLFEEQKQFANKLKVEVAKATKELKVANVQLKKLDRAKSEFISIASHQLRTPLTVIKGYVSMINQGDYGKVPKQIALPLSKTFQNTIRIITLVEDLLNISRIESGRMVYEYEKVDLVALVKEVFEELEHHAKISGLKFEFEKPKQKIPELILDRKKIREVVMNLMDNAIKYTKKGFVKIKIAKENNSIVYSVNDSGRGLEPDDISQLFQKFSRASGAQLVHTEGTGLGLYIAKQIIQKHGGKIWAESDGRGKGSTFAIKLKIDNKKLAKELSASGGKKKK
ncbi:ATP-binding protein, partial [Patescibacteria group bacterium]